MEGLRGERRGRGEKHRHHYAAASVTEQGLCANRVGFPCTAEVSRFFGGSIHEMLGRCGTIKTE